jgi:hypothetical protein
MTTDASPSAGTGGECGAGTQSRVFAALGGPQGRGLRRRAQGLSAGAGTQSRVYAAKLLCCGFRGRGASACGPRGAHVAGGAAAAPTRTDTPARSLPPMHHLPAHLPGPTNHPADLPPPLPPPTNPCSMGENLWRAPAGAAPPFTPPSLGEPSELSGTVYPEVRENTMRGFRQAQQLGVDFIEFDVQVWRGGGGWGAAASDRAQRSNQGGTKGHAAEARVPARHPHLHPDMPNMPCPTCHASPKYHIWETIFNVRARVPAQHPHLHPDSRGQTDMPAQHIRFSRFIPCPHPSPPHR